MRNDAFEWVKLFGMYFNLLLWGLVIPRLWPTFARHIAGDWSDMEGTDD